MEREETFEIPAAVRDRFFMEITIETPDDPALLRGAHDRQPATTTPRP